MGRVNGKVALITGAARGQGRSHAIRLAEEGADIIAVDICSDVESVVYPMASEDDLRQTVKEVEALGRRIVARVVDVRDQAGLSAAVADGVAELGRLDVVCANAGTVSAQEWSQVTDRIWQDTIDINLTGVWNTCVASIPHLISSGGGSIIITSSAAGIKAHPFHTPYAAAKHGVVGLAKSLANELASEYIRVNTVHPTGVNTTMLESLHQQAGPLVEKAPDVGGIFMNTYPVRHVEPVDISNAVLYLASEEARYVTGLEMKVDAGTTIR